MTVRRRFSTAIKDCGGSPEPFSTVRKNNGDPHSPSRRQSGTVGIPRGVLDRHRELWGSPKPFSKAIRDGGDFPRRSRSSSRALGIRQSPSRGPERTMGIPTGILDGKKGQWGTPKPFSKALKGLSTPHERSGRSCPFVLRPQAVLDDHRGRLTSPKP